MFNGANRQQMGRPQMNNRLSKQVGTGNLDISRIPPNAFLTATRKRNIVRACIDSKAPDKRLDIKIVTPMGDSTYIQRNDLLGKYRYLSGKTINLHGWKKDVQYNIYTNDNSQFYFMQVPTNLTATVNGLLANKSKPKVGDYIVCYGGADGKVDVRTGAVIQAKMFHKMFSIPRHPVIAKYKGKKNRTFMPKPKFLVQLGDAKKIRTSRNAGNNAGMNLNNLQKPGTSGTYGTSGKKLNPENPSYGVNAATLPGVDKNIARPLNTPKVNRVKTVGKLMNGQKIVGFVLQIDGKNYKNVEALQMKALIAKGIVTDVMVSHNNYGVEFFRGNGIQIESLPERQVQGGRSLGKYNPNENTSMNSRPVGTQSGGFGNNGQTGRQFGQSGSFGNNGAQSGGFNNPYRQNGGNWSGGWSN